MSEAVTVDTILGYLQRAIEEKLPVAPSVWVDAAQKLVVLLGVEHDLLCELTQRVAQLRLDYLDVDEKRSVSAARARVEASDVYRELCRQKLLCDRISEFVRVSKLRARMLAEEARSI